MLVFFTPERCRDEPDIMAFLKVYNCLPSTPSRLSKPLLDDWNRRYGVKLPKLRSASIVDRIPLLRRTQSRSTRLDGC